VDTSIFVYNGFRHPPLCKLRVNKSGKKAIPDGIFDGINKIHDVRSFKIRLPKNMFC
jgi:hypothetical protein